MVKIGKSLLKNREFPLLESFSPFIFAGKISILFVPLFGIFYSISSFCFIQKAILTVLILIYLLPLLLFFLLPLPHMLVFYHTNRQFLTVSSFHNNINKIYFCLHHFFLLKKQNPIISVFVYIYQ